MAPKAQVKITFEKIRNELDPAYSYLIFESDGGTDEGTFLTVFDFLRGEPLGVCQLQAGKDSSTQKSLLVAKLEPGQAEAIKERVLDIHLPRHMTVYFYRLDARTLTHRAETY